MHTYILEYADIGAGPAISLYWMSHCKTASRESLSACSTRPRPSPALCGGDQAAPDVYLQLQLRPSLPVIPRHDSKATFPISQERQRRSPVFTVLAACKSLGIRSCRVCYLGRCRCRMFLWTKRGKECGIVHYELGGRRLWRNKAGEVEIRANPGE